MTKRLKRDEDIGVWSNVGSSSEGGGIREAAAATSNPISRSPPNAPRNRKASVKVLNEQ